MTAERIRVAVVFGGRSGEHAISCVSAAGVLAELDPEIFEAIPIGIMSGGGWVRVAPDAPLGIVDGRLPAVPFGPELVLSTDPTRRALLPAHPATHSTEITFEVAFPVLHGPYGEDGTIQGLFELADVPYVGAGVLASAAAMDKEFTKKLLAAEGLPVGSYVVLRPGTATLTAEQRAQLGLPVFVKPARAGSSLGVSRVDRWDQLEHAITLARHTDPKVLVEAAVLGREIECGVLEFPDGTLRASPTAEITLNPEYSFYDFAAKYLADAATFHIPSDLPAETTKTVQEYALRAFRALDCQGLARVDFFIAADGTVSINEVNTMPGFTPISMYPRMFAADGISYSELLTVLLRTALGRGTGLR